MHRGTLIADLLPKSGQGYLLRSKKMLEQSKGKHDLYIR
jgi:hypothetical protein